MAIYHGKKKVGGNGFTPHIDSETLNWIIGATDTGVNSRGDGAYDLAVRAGFTGTEEEFSQMLNDFITFEDESETVEYPDNVDADTLCGKPPSDFASKVHTHKITDLLGVAPESHTHTSDDLSGVASESHTHDIADLSGVASSVHQHNYNDITDAPIQNGILDSYPATGKSLRNIFISSTEPTDAEGNDGDIWIVVEGA